MISEDELKYLADMPVMATGIEVADMARELLQRRWTPVSERLPEEGKEVLVFISWPEMPESEMASSYEMGILHTNCFYEAQEGGYKLKYVNHWMPLPEPPEVE